MESYSFKAVGPGAAVVTIKRQPDGLVQRGASNCSQEQFAAYQRACDYVGRNDDGDYDAAYDALSSAFDEVFATPSRPGPGRPVERSGNYRRVSLEIRADLDEAIRARGLNRRELIERLLEQEFASEGEGNHA